jgi:hypothetical protein
VPDPSVRPTIVVASPVPQVLSRLTAVLGGPVVLVGGWSVQCRLRMARAGIRPTEDIDVLLRREQRPARKALEQIDAVQADLTHPCRLSGLPVVVDLLAGDEPALTLADDDDPVVDDADGLRLLRPPMGPLLARTSEPVVLEADDDGTTTPVLLPRAGALFAMKVVTLTLVHRPLEKRESDAEDVLRLLASFGTLALLDDLEAASAEERRITLVALGQLGASGIRACAGGRGDEVLTPERLDLVVEALAGGLDRSSR